MMKLAQSKITAQSLKKFARELLNRIEAETKILILLILYFSQKIFLPPTKKLYSIEFLGMVVQLCLSKRTQEQEKRNVRITSHCWALCEFWFSFLRALLRALLKDR